MKAVFKHEMKMYFSSITAYVFMAFLLVFTGIGALVYNINRSISNFEYVLSFVSMVFIVIVPLITMKTIADERRQKTDQLLYSLPIRTSGIVLGKFFSLAVIYAIPVAVICIYPLIFSRFGDVYLPTSYGTIIAFLFMGLALMSIGMFISSLTESQGIAAGVCVAVMLVNYFSSDLADMLSSSAIGTLIFAVILLVLLGIVLRIITKSNFVAWGIAGILIAACLVIFFANATLLEGLLPKLMNTLSIFDRLDTFTNGVFDLTAIVYYLSVTVFFIFLSTQALEKRRYNG